MKKGGGRRYYRREDITLLSGIRALLYDDGLSIKDVQKQLKAEGVADVAARAEQTSPHRTDVSDTELPVSDPGADEDEDDGSTPESEPGETHERLSGALEKLLKARKQLNETLEKH